MTEHFAQLSINTYQRAIRGATRNLWRGDIDEAQFVSRMRQLMEFHFERAWRAGEKECGIRPEERTPEESARKFDLIAQHLGFLGKFSTFVFNNRKSEGGKFGAVKVRADMWANRFTDVANQAKTLACGNKKLKWVLGPTEHCKSCLRLAGQVRRASIWSTANIRPQHPDLECGGYRCQCKLEITDAQATRGIIPAP